MPNTKSAKKRMRQSDARRLRNKSRKSFAWTQEKKFRAALSKGDLDAAEKALGEAASAYDKAAKNNAIHLNKANRKKARLTAALAKAKAGA